MVDKWQAQDRFWNSFGIPAYDQNTVPQTAVMPYITYEAVSSNFEAPVMITASVWYRSSSWKDVSNKVDDIADYVRDMPPSIEIEGGRYKVRFPDSLAFAQRLADENDYDVRRIVLNLQIEFLTEV